MAKQRHRGYGGLALLEPGSKGQVGDTRRRECSRVRDQPARDRGHPCGPTHVEEPLLTGRGSSEGCWDPTWIRGTGRGGRRQMGHRVMPGEPESGTPQVAMEMERHGWGGASEEGR